MTLTYPPVDESLWSELRTLFDWQQGFGLVILYTDDPTSIAGLRARFADVARLRSRGLRVLAPESPDTAVQEVVSQLLDRASVPANAAPVWIELLRDPEGEGWNTARHTLLARLNERRSALAGAIHALIVFVLPTAWQAQFAASAPDLWSVRSLSRRIAARTRPVIERDHVRSDALPRVLGAATPQELRLDAEWKRLIDLHEPARIDPVVAHDLVGLLVARGALDRARQVAAEALKAARARASRSGDSGALRDLSVSLNNVGLVESELGRWEAAGEAYRESLALRRRLKEEIGETPQALRDLSISLDNVGRVESELGRWEAAGEAYRESLALSRRLKEEIGETPQALRDLSVSLNNVGRVESELGRWEAAGEAYRESLALSRRLKEEIGETPQALRDLSVSLNNVGRVESELGRWEAAGEAYRESLALRRRLKEEIGETPQALRDLSISLDNVGRVESELGRWEAAGEAYRESLALSRRLKEEIGETPQSLGDLGYAHRNLALVARQLNDRAGARMHCASGLDAFERAAAAAPAAVQWQRMAEQMRAQLGMPDDQPTSTGNR